MLRSSFARTSVVRQAFPLDSVNVKSISFEQQTAATFSKGFCGYLRRAFSPSCFRGAFPPVLLFAFCFVTAIPTFLIWDFEVFSILCGISERYVFFIYCRIVKRLGV